MYKNREYLENSCPNWSKLGSFLDHIIWILFLDKMGKRLCNSAFHFLPMPLVSNVKNQSKVPKSLLVSGQCLDRIMFCLKPFDFNDFTLKLTKYLVFPNSHFCVKV